jgi:hypothetical protein
VTGGPTDPIVGLLHVHYDRDRKVVHASVKTHYLDPALFTIVRRTALWQDIVSHL